LVLWFIEEGRVSARPFLLLITIKDCVTDRSSAGR